MTFKEQYGLDLSFDGNGFLFSCKDLYMEDLTDESPEISSHLQQPKSNLEFWPDEAYMLLNLDPLPNKQANITPANAASISDW